MTEEFNKWARGLQDRAEAYAATEQSMKIFQVEGRNEMCCVCGLLCTETAFRVPGLSGLYHTLMCVESEIDYLMTRHKYADDPFSHLNEIVSQINESRKPLGNGERLAAWMEKQRE